MAAAEMKNGCGLGQWQTNSQVAMAVSNTPIGPYTKYEVGTSQPAGVKQHEGKNS
jgi:hypothetical protein